MNLWRYQWLLYGVVACIVIVPYFMLERVNRVIHQADQMVAHTAQVESVTSKLLYEVRDLEAAAATITEGIDVPNVRRRVAETSGAIPKLMSQLIELTSDNPQQQVRVGELKAKIEQRRSFSLRIIDESNQAERRRLLASVVNDFPMRGAANDVLNEETRLFAERSAEAVRLRKQGHWINLLTTTAQLALLCLLLWTTLRYQRERQIAEETATRANARALAVMQSIREPIALLDRDKHVVMHNAAFEELYGTDDDDIDGKHLREIGSGAWTNRETLQRLRDVVSRGRELWDFEIEQTTADGIQRTMLLNARRMNLPDREDEVALVILSDISNQKASEEEISELNRQLEGKIEQVSDVNRELEAFSYSVSHDLRAPLRHISGFAEKLGRQLGDDADDKSRHYIATIDNSARRMATLIDDLLVYSRLGRSALRLQPVDMQSLVAETRALLDSNVSIDTPDRKIEWHIDVMPMVVADENMMRQVWLNLLGNAVKYSTPRERTHIDVGYQRLDDGRHEFTVKDNGVGFDMQYAGKLFGVFQRMHKASDFPGTGIGLASVQRVLTRHGGMIAAESAVDQGTTFRFTLPAMLDNPVKSLSTDT
ncbi:sensor histidine kinase [Solilutibacter tolerans]|uniref:histidine kinase n=1 Tax=Solilutibacter tolerans TaxID=1604334 RepID=A0A1N6XEM0_9GAMM|nr:ATP-binding protein [Lysobacter tolerans]SIR00798.1 PAS domain S-box-containing protein [Lysobacter tolerans]